MTVTSITQLLSQLLAATGKPRQAKRAALKRLLGRERLTPPAVRVYGRGGKAVTW